MTYKTKEDIQIAEEMISPPGETLEEILDSNGMNQTELAERMNRPQKTINEIIKGKASITPETAIQLQHVLGLSAEFWLEREKSYQLEREKINQAKRFFELKDWLKQFPLSAMKKMGWINYNGRQALSKAEAVFAFFAVSDNVAYEKYYQQNYQRAYRSTDKRTKNPSAVNAWLRKGELQAMELEAPEYCEKKFKQVLSEVKSLMAEQPDSFFEKLQSLCLEAGVKVVYTPCLPGTKLHGSTSWIKGNPVIQLSNQYKRNDIFWFTFFHEAGHILKHGKKDIFVEGADITYTKEGLRKEEEADSFAVRYVFSKKEEQRFLELMGDTEDKVQLVHDFAREINTHPAIIIGRLAKEGYIHDSEGWKHHIYRKIDLSTM